MTRRPSPEADGAGRIALRGLLWMTVGESNLGGPGRISLLRAIRDAGTITHAARAIGISYKAAWDAIDLMNRLAGEPLVVRTPGGRGGGSTRVTERGERLIERFEEADRMHRRFVEALSAACNGLQQAIDPSAGMDDGIETGTRNRLPGVVAAICARRARDEVELALPGGPSVFAALPPGGAERLGLAEGSPAVALFDPSSVIVSAGAEAALSTRTLSTRNRLPGIVEQIRPGPFESELVLALTGGAVLVAAIADESIQRLKLSVGARAAALFQETQVVLALPVP